MSHVICETSNATVASFCCTQLSIPLAMGSTTATITPQSTPKPTSIRFATCGWTASPNSTGISEIESWLACTDQYANTTIDSMCTLMSSAARSIKTKGPVKRIGMTVLVGVIVQMVLAIE